MNQVWLNVDSLGQVSEAVLKETISGLAGEVMWAQVQGAGLDRFGRVDDTELTDQSGVAVDFARLFDIRVFGPRVELHALRRGDMWEAVVATEYEDQTDGAIPVESSRYEAIIWGTASNKVESAKGWTVMESLQVGTVAVPVATDYRATLETTEYRDHTEQGNAYLQYSRLSAIRSKPRPKPKGEGGADG